MQQHDAPTSQRDGRIKTNEIYKRWPLWIVLKVVIHSIQFIISSIQSGIRDNDKCSCSRITSYSVVKGYYNFFFFAVWHIWTPPELTALLLILLLLIIMIYCRKRFFKICSTHYLGRNITNFKKRWTSWIPTFQRVLIICIFCRSSNES